MLTTLEFPDSIYLIPIIILTSVVFYVIHKLSRPYELVVDSNKYRYFKNRDGNQYDEGPPSIHPNGWVPLIESCELSRNQIKPIKAFGKDLIVYRGSSGKCYVFDAYCPHLGANLAIGGTVTGESVECPFHGWVFDMNGKCTHIPGTEFTSNAQLNKYEAIEQNDCVLVWYHSNGDKPGWYPVPIEELKQSNVRFIGRAKNVFNGVIREVFENPADYQHAITVHGAPVFLGNLSVKPSLYSKILKIFYYDFQPAQHKIGTGKNKHTYHLVMDSTLVVFGYRVLTFRIHADMYGPYLANIKIVMNMVFKFNFYMYDILMQDHNITLLHRLYSDAGPALNWIISRVVLKNIAHQVERDCIIWINKKYRNNPMLSKHEKSLAETRRWSSQFY